MKVSLSNKKKGDFGTVKMGNHVMSKIVDIEDVILSTNIGSKLLLKGGRHVHASKSYLHWETRQC